MKHWKSLLVCSLLASASMHAAACYTVYDRSGRIVYHAQVPPVDMSRPLHETLPARFAGGHMIFDTAAQCDAINPIAPVVSRSQSAPLLTDQRTARAMNVPHTVLTNGIALVQPGAAVLRPGVTVLPSQTSSAGRDTVITEMRNPPLTIVESRERSAADATRAMGAGPSR